MSQPPEVIVTSWSRLCFCST